MQRRSAAPSQLAKRALQETGHDESPKSKRIPLSIRSNPQSPLSTVQQNSPLVAGQTTCPSEAKLSDHVCLDEFISFIRLEPSNSSHFNQLLVML